MSGLTASVSTDPEPGRRALVVGVNWLGDGIMAMPALQAFRARHPETEIHLLLKPSQLGLWAMHAAPDRLLTLATGRAGMRETIRTLRAENYDSAWVLPNSFRAAWLTQRAGIPLRRGVGGRGRHLLLNSRVRPCASRVHTHQCWENADILLPGWNPETPLPSPQLTPSAKAAERVELRLQGLTGPIIACLPGAARGPSKQWPPENYAACARALQQACGATILWLGSPAEKELGATLAAKVPGSLHLAGQTGLEEFSALLARADAVTANDSGGMHLAAALGTPLVAVFGITDPDKTGPLGPSVTVLQRSEIRARKIPRESEEARRALQAIRPEEVCDAVLSLLHVAAKEGIIPS